MKIKKFLSKGILLIILFSTQTLFGGEMDVKKSSFEDFYKTYMLKGAESSALVLNGNHAPIPKNAPMDKLRADGVVEKIDSVVTVNEIGNLSKEEYQYFDQGYLKKYIGSFYEKGMWVAWRGEEFAYDAKGRQAVYIIYEGYIPETSSWTMGQKYEYVYDENGFVSQTTIYVMSDNSPWIEDSKLVQVNNEQGLVMEGIAYSWKNGVWVPTNKAIYDYDEDGDLILDMKSIWANNAWLNTIKQVIIEDPDHMCVENYKWENNAWLGLNRQEFRYFLTEDGKRGNNIYEALADFVNNQFRVFIEVRSMYNDDNLLILQEIRMVDMDSNETELKFHSKQTYSYGPLDEFEGFDEFKDIAVQREGVLVRFNPDGSTVVDLKDIALYIAGDQVAKTTYLWNEESGEWKGQTRSTNVPGTVSNPVFTNTDYGWHLVYKAWVPIVQIIETRVSAVGERQLKEMIAKLYNSAYETDKTIDPLINYNRFTYEYGSDNVLTRQVNYTWNKSANEWKIKEGKVQEFDYSISVDQIYGPVSLLYDPYSFKSKPIYIERLAADADEIYAAETMIFYYSKVDETAIPSIEANGNAKAYFAENTLVVETPNAETVSIYALTGNLLFSGNKSEGNASFGVSLASGVYIVKGSTGWSEKIIK